MRIPRPAKPKPPPAQTSLFDSPEGPRAVTRLDLGSGEVAVVHGERSPNAEDLAALAGIARAASDLLREKYPRGEKAPERERAPGPAPDVEVEVLALGKARDAAARVEEAVLRRGGQVATRGWGVVNERGQWREAEGARPCPLGCLLLGTRSPSGTSPTHAAAHLLGLCDPDVGALADGIDFGRGRWSAIDHRRNAFVLAGAELATRLGLR